MHIKFRGSNTKIDIQATYPPLDSELGLGFPNAFVSAFFTAYNHHLGLELSPDHIWLAICQGFTQHILANSEEMRKFFVDFDGKKELEFRDDSFVFGSPDNNWPIVFN